MVSTVSSRQEVPASVGNLHGFPTPKTFKGRLIEELLFPLGVNVSVTGSQCAG